MKRLSWEQSVEDAVTATARGELVVVDDIDRENEGDFMLILLVVLIATCAKSIFYVLKKQINITKYY